MLQIFSGICKSVFYCCFDCAFSLLSFLGAFEALGPNFLMWMFFTFTNSSKIYGIWFTTHPEHIGRSPSSKTPKRSKETQIALEWLNSYLWFASIPQGMLMMAWYTSPFSKQNALFMSMLWFSWWIVWWKGVFKYKIWKTWCLIIFIPFRLFELFGALYCTVY